MLIRPNEWKYRIEWRSLDLCVSFGEFGIEFISKPYISFDIPS